MRELIFQVEFLSDIVLPATSNTEGNIEQLDFIPGSNFLGMTAKEYGQFEDSFAVFHSGAVRFGDATILVKGKRTYKMPLSYFHEKLNDSKIFNHHLITNFSDFNQLKQKRNGFITENLDVVYVDYNYSQKSAYDKKHRRSLDSSMFGYSAIEQGTNWQFSIKIDEAVSGKDLELIKKSIVGKKRLGKSKSAQYGLVDIIAVENETPASVKSEIILPDAVVLYVNSRLALVDEQGNPTYDLKYLLGGLGDENIDYARCQIKTSSFTPYNGARQAKDYERVCISKGSVIVLKDISAEQIAKIKRGVGAYLSEGFGEILVNPGFLSEYSLDFKEKNSNREEIKKIEVKSDLAKFLKQRRDHTKAKLDIMDKVDDFIKDHYTLYGKIKNSQWGKIRSICTSGEDIFHDEIRKYISNGVKAWDAKQIDTLLEKDHSLEFIKLISIQMPKVKYHSKEQKDEN